LDPTASSSFFALTHALQDNRAYSHICNVSIAARPSLSSRRSGRCRRDSLSLGAEGNGLQRLHARRVTLPPLQISCTFQKVPSKLLIWKWWPETGSNRRRRPFQGWQLGHKPIFEAQKFENRPVGPTNLIPKNQLASALDFLPSGPTWVHLGPIANSSIRPPTSRDSDETAWI
jgi:hypothetical protein